MSSTKLNFRSEICGRAYTMTIVTDKSDMTVGEVKLHLQNTYLIPADQQILYFSGVYLENSHLLSGYGIGNGSRLDIMSTLDDHRSSVIWTSTGRKAKMKEEAPNDGCSWVSSGEFDCKVEDQHGFFLQGKQSVL